MRRSHERERESGSERRRRRRVGGVWEAESHVQEVVKLCVCVSVFGND